MVRQLGLAILAMASVIIASNILVQHPLHGTLGPLVLADVLTYGAFTYPIAFLITDLINRTYGPERARTVVYAGFALAVTLPFMLAAAGIIPVTPARIALASGTTFLLAQLFDISLFNRFRYAVWWRAPLASSVAASMLDTAVFFTLAFTAAIPFAVDGFAVEVVPLFGIEGAPAMARWVSWAIADFCVKVLVAFLALGPYRLMTVGR